MSLLQHSAFSIQHCKEARIAFDRGPRRDDRTRVNERIRVREVRVIDDTGAQLGIMAPQQALTIARQKGLDLVEIAATAVPPVCRIMDFGRYQYQEQKRARQAKKHQKIIEVKEIKFRPKVDEHDYQFKKKHIERFLAEGDKVKATIFFRGREMAHPEIGRRILERLIDDLGEVAIAENDAAAGRQPDAHDSGAARRRQAARTRSGNRRRRRKYGRRGSDVKGHMPKLKTHRGAAKRFKRTGTGKIVRSKAFKQHILTSKTRSRKRKLRGTVEVSDGDYKKLESDDSPQVSHG